jgi:hypothetical protein
MFPNVFPARPPTMELAPDGFLYLRYFPWRLYPPYVPNWTDYFLKAKHHIETGLTKHSGSIRSKYEFTRDEFNFAVVEYQDYIEPIVKPIL